MAKAMWIILAHGGAGDGYAVLAVGLKTLAKRHGWLGYMPSVKDRRVGP